ncbi:MAG: ATP-binding cassette domain-containing protein [Acidimicrobiales bacterium]
MTVELELVNARAGYGSVEVLHGVSLALPAGAVVAVVGRNGAGKTTLLRTIAGTLPLNSGTVCWRGRDVTNQTAQQRAIAGVAFVPDEDNVFVSLTVRENLALFGGGDAALEPVLSTFPELRALLDRRAGTLSGGEQQMLALCRAVLRPGRVVLLDEVSRGLSPTVQPRLYSAIASLVTPQRAIVVVEQYLVAALELADFVYVMRRGHVAFAGEASELRGATTGPALG